jgi:hypothetical protein
MEGERCQFVPSQRDAATAVLETSPPAASGPWDTQLECCVPAEPHAGA